MDKEMRKMVLGFSENHRRRSVWKRVLSCLGAVVVFCTTYALILPAITMEMPELPPEVTMTTVKEQICTPGHTHGEGCRDGSGGLICGTAEYVLHEHDALCYYEGKLICTLAEMHCHGDGCYQRTEGHSHGEACYTQVQGALCCTTEEHSHGAGCYGLSCQFAEEAGHAHGAECYDEQEVLTCQLQEQAGHSHSEACFAGELVCQQETHAHGDGCYAVTSALTCQMEEIAAQEVLVCQKEAVDAHFHSEECGGNFSCGLHQPVIHQHSEGCFAARQVAAAQTEGNLTDQGVGGVQTDPSQTGDVQNSDPSEPADRQSAGDPPSQAPGADGGDIGLFVLEPQTTPLDISTYVTTITVKCYNNNDGVYEDVAAGTPITGNNLQVQYEYKDIPIKSIKDCGYQLTIAAPEFLKTGASSGELQNANCEKIGDITLADGKVTLQFIQEKIDAMTDTVLSGNFMVQGEVNLSSVGTEPSTYTVGKAKVTIQFEEKYVEKHIPVTVSKVSEKLEEREGGTYIDYTITVQNSGDVAAPNVVVTDTFSSGKDLIECYVQPTVETEQSVQSSSQADGAWDGKGDLIWTINSIPANGSVVLNYSVKLNSNYVIKPGMSIENRATATVNGQVRNDIEPGTAKTPTDAGLNMRKWTNGETVNLSNQPTLEIRTENGHIYIDYCVWVHAVKKDNNTPNDFTLKGVTIEDMISFPAGYSQAIDYVEYKPNSFKLTDGNGNDVAFNESSQVTYSETGKGFTANIGDLLPGEQRFLKYTVDLGSQALVSKGIDNIKMNNDAVAFAENAEGGIDYGGRKALQRWNHNSTNNVFSYKLIEKVQPGGATTAATEFHGVTIPAGSYRFEINLNKDQGWDLSEATVKDEIVADENGKRYLQYIGKAEVKATTGETTSTALVDINGTSFEFAINTLAFSPEFTPSGNTQYTITYYAAPAVEGTAMVATNQVSIIGPGTFGTVPYQINLSTEVQTTVTGNNHLSATKNFWYVDRYARELYWYIQVDAGYVPRDFKIQDEITEVQTNITNHSMMGSSFVGAYVGPENAFTGTTQSPKPGIPETLTQLDPSLYTVTKESDRLLSFQLQDNYPLEEGQRLYLVIRTKSDVWSTGEGRYTYKNKVKIVNGSDYAVCNHEDSESVYSESLLIKTNQMQYLWDGTKATPMANTSGDALTFTGADTPGVYVAWKVKLNKGGTMGEGIYEVREQIPAGLELARVILSYKGSNAGSAECVSCSENYPDYIAGEYTSSAGTSYYYVNGQDVRWQVQGLPATNTRKDENSIDFQVLCRVTDPNVLMNGQTGSYGNTATLYQGEVPLETSSATQSVQVSTLQKGSATIETSNSSTIPFTITVNPGGLDLVPDSDTITLIDRMGSSMTLDIATLQVLDKDQVPVENVKPQWDAAANTLTMVLPDSKEMTITYDTKIVAAPGNVEIFNQVYWEGYSAAPGSTVSKNDYEYAVSGSVSTSTKPTVNILKVDANNILTKLSGATFEMVELNEAKTETGNKWTGTTDQDGRLTLSTSGSNTSMLYNTVYRIVETKAPAGYVLDSTPHYFAVCNTAASEGYTIPAKIGDYAVQRVQGTEYDYQVTNHKGVLNIDKQFLNAGGETMGAVTGVYQFGIYTSQTPGAETPVGTVTVTISNGSTTQSAFTDLALGSTYYIFELDDSGNPILEGARAYCSGKPFLVSYTNNEVKPTAQVTVVTATIANRIAYPELPHTGGMGSHWLTGAGTGMILAALAAAICRGEHLGIFQSNTNNKRKKANK